MKCCTCKIDKPIEDFHKNKKSCKLCRKIERKNSYDKRKLSSYQEILQYNKEWNSKNPENVRESKKKWRQANKELCRIHCNKRYSYAKKARPTWANTFFIEEAYLLSQLRTKMFGFRWEVDHIFPIRGKDVCGLHVESNLQIIPRTINASKQNKHTKQYKWSEFFQDN